MDQDGKKITPTSVLVPPDLKRWLELKAVDRVLEGRPLGQRSVSAIVVELIEAARADDKEVTV